MRRGWVREILNIQPVKINNSFSTALILLYWMVTLHGTLLLDNLSSLSLQINDKKNKISYGQYLGAKGPMDQTIASL